jgi:GTP diphosphokinase / guanosine-3',5'-bis(diphosphate) 3'-diphosphatase
VNPTRTPPAGPASDAVALARAFDFAARRHAGQKRKGSAGEPYVDHLAEVALLLAEATAGADPSLVIAGLLHDCVEDGHATAAEIASVFGTDVAGLVEEVTDEDLPEAERRQRQVETAPHKSDRAKMLKLADKISNLREMHRDPPSDWPLGKRRDYFEWGRKVADGLRGVSPGLEEQFDAAYREGMDAILAR